MVGRALRARSFPLKEQDRNFAGDRDRSSGKETAATRIGMGEVVGLGENIDGVVAVLRVLRNVCKGRFDGPSRAFEQVVKLISMTANVFFNRFQELIGKARHHGVLFAMNDDLPQSVQDEGSVLISSHA